MKISRLDLKPSQKLLLYILKERQADAGEGLQITLERLGEYAGINRNQISIHLKALQDAGYVVYTSGKGKASSIVKLTL